VPDEGDDIMRRTLVTSSLLALVATVPISASSASFDDALEAIDQCDYSRAVAPLRAAADSGDVRAQRLLGFMFLHGPSLYPGVARDRNEAVLRLRQASAQGSQEAALVLNRIADVQAALARRR